MSDYESDYNYWSKNKQSLTEQHEHPNYWLNRSSDLRASAHVLWLSMESEDLQQRMGYGGGFSLKVACHPVYHMLCGLALELILKAVLVQRKAVRPNIHDLNQLAGLVGVKVVGQRKDLLKFYTAAIAWTGRYPIPVNCDDGKLLDYWELAQNVLSTPVKTTGILTFRTSTHVTSWDNFNEIFNEYRALFVLDH